MILRRTRVLLLLQQLLEVGFLSGAALREQNHAMKHLRAGHPAQVTLFRGQGMHTVRRCALRGDNGRGQAVRGLVLRKTQNGANQNDGGH